MVSSGTERSRASAEQRFQTGIRAHLAGQVDAAIRAYREALETDPRHAAAHNNLGALLAAQDKTVDAASHFRAAVDAQPAYGDAWNNLGILLAASAQYTDAIDAFRRATSLEPDKAGWFNNLGNALVEEFQFREAVQAYDRAIAIEPGNPDVWANRAIALRGLREPAAAIASAQQALAIDPSHTAALNNLGALLREERRFDEAIATYQRAIAACPGDAALVANLASVYERSGDLANMRAVATQARDLDPTHPEPWNLLANAEMEAARFDEAERLYRHAVSLDPQNRNANWNLALIWLLKGDLTRGWPQFEWRKRLQSVVTDHGSYRAPEWTGAALDGRTILVHTEQGVGDALQFIRYAPLLHARGAGRVIVEAPFPLVPLLQTARGVDHAVARGTALPPFDVHVSLMSLPLLLGTTLETIPADVPYLATEPRPAADVVASSGGEFKVGIVWAGNPIHSRDHFRSAPLDAFVALSRTEGVRCFSLQKGEGPEAALRTADAPIVDLAPMLQDFRDTAAAIQALDLVISVDTSVAHLAGALAVPTWVLLPSVPDFRWMIGRDDSPWYPTMRLFRQESPGAWDGVFRRVHEALREQAKRGRAPVADAPRDVLTVAAATRYPDGRPRYDLWVPLADLADARVFSEYEAELTGGGAYPELRRFLSECLGPRDVLIDADPGLGTVALDVATADLPAAALHLVGSRGEGRRIAEMIRLRAPRVDVEVHLALAGALTQAARQQTTGGRLVLRAGQRPADEIVAACRDCAVVPDIVTCLGADDPTHALRRWLAAEGHQIFALGVAGSELSLDMLPDDTGAREIVALSPAVVAALTGQPVAACEQEPRRVVAIDWELRSDTGWGVYGTNLALELSLRSGVVPALLSDGAPDVHPLARHLWSGRPILRGDDAGRAVGGGIVLHALGNALAGSPLLGRTSARRQVGVAFVEDTALDAAALQRGRALDLIVAGSTWNEEVLTAAGLSSVRTVLQGIDPTVFHPAPRRGLFPGRFVIFTGGKLEFRKGQDIVVAVFREFVRRHPEALLLVAWHNAWPQLLCDLDLAGHVHGLPELADGTLNVVPWLVANGIPAPHVVDVGRQPNALMGQVLREADVALFTNRAEGGTNLVAMESMAAGVATLVSHNTGHRDLVRLDGGQPLGRQGTVPRPTRYFTGTEGWGESSVDEALALLERAFTDTAWRQELARRGADALGRLTWAHQTDELLDVLEPLW